MQMTLPTEFCWTRIGVEAGQSLESIFRRKNQERAANDGLFYWGIGNAIGPSMAELVRRCSDPEVVFSPIKSAPRSADVTPESVVAWTNAVGFDGSPYALPQHALITSRLNLKNPKKAHYALVCAAETTLAPTNIATVDIGDLENLLTGRPVGASQVTAVVRHSRKKRTEIRTYSAVLRVKLKAPFLLRLQSPIRLTEDCSQPWDHVVTEFWTQKLSIGA